MARDYGVSCDLCGVRLMAWTEHREIQLAWPDGGGESEIIFKKDCCKDCADKVSSLINRINPNL